MSCVTLVIAFKLSSRFFGSRRLKSKQTWKFSFCRANFLRCSNVPAIEQSIFLKISPQSGSHPKSFSLQNYNFLFNLYLVLIFYTFFPSKKNEHFLPFNFITNLHHFKNELIAVSIHFLHLFGFVFILNLDSMETKVSIDRHFFLLSVKNCSFGRCYMNKLLIALLLILI
jgi:hypothetical protein